MCTRRWQHRIYALPINRETPVTTLPFWKNKENWLGFGRKNAILSNSRESKARSRFLALALFLLYLLCFSFSCPIFHSLTWHDTSLQEHTVTEPRKMAFNFVLSYLEWRHCTHGVFISLEEPLMSVKVKQNLA